MALNKTTLANEIVTALKPLNGELTGQAETDAIARWEKIAGAIIDHFKANAVISAAGTDPPGDGGTVNVTGTISA